MSTPMKNDHQIAGAVSPEVSDAMEEARQRATGRRRDMRRGVLMMVVAMLMLPGIDAIAKSLSGELSPGQLSWGRFFFQTIFLFGFVLFGDGFRVGRNIWKHAGRGCLIATATVLFFMAISEMPLADTMAIFFVEPLILTLLAPWLLKEHVGWRRMAAVVVGLAGSLLVIQPSFREFGLVALYPVGAATGMAFYIILTRSLTRDTGTFTMQFFAGVFGALFMSMALAVGTSADIAPLTFIWPTPVQWVWIMALAAVATVGHLLIVQAVRRIGAAMIAPFQYLEIVSATFLGYVVFGDFPGPAIWFGMAIIIAAGLYVFYREQVRAGED
ncbi:MAG: DMT family transporter [Rhodospirillales bacterium]